MTARRAGVVPAMAAAALPMFTVTMNNLVVTSALPSMGRDLGLGLDLLQWVFIAYVLVFAAGLPAAAAIGERLGNRRLYVAAIAVFGLASVVCATANDIAVLIVGRVVQGAAAAAVLPCSLVLLVATVPAARRGLAVGIWSGLGGLALALGAVIGGAVTSGLSWRAIFWINVPVAVLALPLALLVFRAGRPGTRRPDLVGMLLLGLGVGLVVWAAATSPDRGWFSASTLGALAAAVLVLGAFAWWQRRVAEPLLPLAFYRNRTLVLADLACLTLYFGVFGSVYFLMQYLQGPMGFTPVGAGLATLPWTCMPLVAAPLTGMLLARVRAGTLLAAAALLQAAGLGWIALIASPGLAYSAVVPAMVLAGTGMGMEFAVTNELALRSVPADQQNLAVGSRNTAAEVGGVLGVAVLSSVFLHFQERAGGSGAGAFVAGLVPAIAVGVAVVALGVVAGLLVRRERAADPAVARPVEAGIPA